MRVPSTGSPGLVAPHHVPQFQMSPVNVVELYYEKGKGRRHRRASYRLYSTLWGARQKTPPLFVDTWARLRAAAKEMKLSRDARNRLDWMIWYKTAGAYNARRTCRHFGIAPKVFYFWRKRFSETNLASLEDRSHRPHRVRPSTLTGEQMERIVQLRTRYLRYSKMKLAILYREKFAESISTWEIQQVIERFKLYPNPKRAENAAAKRRRAWKKKRITELQTKPNPGFLFCLDTVVRHFDGAKRYILTAIDRHSRLAFARMYPNHGSLAAADFLRRLHQLVGGQMVHVQTDNGSEFHKHFDVAMRDLKLSHWWSRVRMPKDNAVCERFNRTLQDEFIADGNAHSDPVVFNRKLTDWLIEYDFHRPHAALGYRRPIEVASRDRKVLLINPSHTLY